MLQIVRALFGKSRRASSSKRRPSERQVQLRLEQLESRESPATLSFASAANIYGRAVLNGAASTALRSLQSFNSGDIVKRTSGSWSQSYVSLTNYSGASSFKYVDITTSAYVQGGSTSGLAVAQTTSSSSGYTYVTVHIGASSGERIGQRVQVTLTPRFVSTIGQNNQGSAANYYSFFVNGQRYLDGVDRTWGIETFSRTVTFTSTIGSSFQIAFQVGSQVSGGGNIGTIATNNFSLGMQVTRI
jgi:hypothetical protein